MSELTAATPYKDRTAGLIVVGILEICLALLFLVNLGFLGIAALAAGTSTAMPQAPNVRALLGAGLVLISYRVFPVFGRIVTGPPAILGCLLLAVLNGLLAVAVYHRRPAAWWAVAGLGVLGCASGAFFFAGGGLKMREMYEAMGVATPELARTGIYDIWKQPAVPVLATVAPWRGSAI